MKAKFREALDKKKPHAGVNPEGQEHHGKAEGTHAAETSASEQSFHRKSGM
ncbi:DUF5302 domain-containing protein [Ornithinimicrobium sp. Arc0846-15]|uniref:DUF5302 domain-containing protein n=1 Tax=Ornithinimicrobium sp. INDO-MA30-4 TaxID=2908651 RepID=UPI001C680C11|nr:DUF5302 domain-containing protein [Ornithinimicrobium sp. INDO-MA30-4]MBW8171996.1 DUF5302 domain-containing protein [Ornithinimicrobium laminariae]UJH70573.1 DUF5302 domain-containing protein [Ornithinimicrobium sp. INDO-MA30-4]